MADVGLRIEGLRELRSALRKVDPTLTKQLGPINKKAAQTVVPLAQRLAPHRSGRLAGSIRALGSQRQGQIAVGRASVPYAGPIHWGWPARNIRPNPFLAKAAARRADEIRDVWSREVDDVIDRAMTLARHQR